MSRGLGHVERRRKDQEKKTGKHCDAAQLLLQFEGDKELGQEQGPNQWQPMSPGSGQTYIEH